MQNGKEICLDVFWFLICQRLCDRILDAMYGIFITFVLDGIWQGWEPCGLGPLLGIKKNLFQGGKGF